VRKGKTLHHQYMADSAIGWMVQGSNPDRAYPASYSMSTGVFFLGGKATFMAWTGKTTFIVFKG